VIARSVAVTSLRNGSFAEPHSASSVIASVSPSRLTTRRNLSSSGWLYKDCPDYEIRLKFLHLLMFLTKRSTRRLQILCEWCVLPVPPTRGDDFCMSLPAVSKRLSPLTTGLIFSLVVVGSVFIVTLFWRLQLASQVTGDRAEMVTAQIYAWLQNWVHEGPLSIDFTMPYLPLSIESFDLRHREELYRSYPPGVLIPPYLLFLLFKQAPISLLTSYGLACHAISVVSTVVAVFFVTVRAAAFVATPKAIGPVLSASLLAISAGIFMTVASGPSYFFTRIYVFDTAVLPWFGLAIALEAIYTTNLGSHRIARSVFVLQLVVFTIGLWTEWLFVILFFVWVTIRIVEPRLGIAGAISARRAVRMGGAVILINLILIFAWRLRAGIDQSDNYGIADEFIRTVYRFLYRAGATTQDTITMPAFLDRIHLYLVSYFAINTFQFLLIFFASTLSVFLTLILTRKFERSELLWPLVSVATLSTVPAFADLALLPQHAFYHDFTMAKFAFPMALLFLTLAPAAVSVFFAKMSEKYLHSSLASCETIYSVLACGAAIFGIYFSMTRYDAPQRHFPPVQGGIGVLGTIIERNVEYDDVVFSPQIEIAHMTFEAGFSRKLVHRSQDVDRDLPGVMGGICRPFNLVIVSDETERPTRTTPPSEVLRDSGLVFYRWRKLPAVGAGCK
jgi:hypothetical protein